MIRYGRLVPVGRRRRIVRSDRLSKFVGVRMLDGSQGGFGPLAGVESGFEVREGVPFSCGLSGVEIVREDKAVGCGPLGRQRYRCVQ
jgi:hypothetical protein